MTTRFLIFFFIAICLGYVLADFCINNYFITEELQSRELSKQMSDEAIKGMMKASQKFDLLSYIITPIVYLFYAAVASMVIYIGFLARNEPLRFVEIFRVAIVAQGIFLLPKLIKIIFFSFKNDYTLKEINIFSPLSMLNLFDYEQLEGWIIYPLQTLNLFEFGYMFLFAFILSKTSKKELDLTYSTVLLAYGLSLLFLVISSGLIKAIMS